MSRSPNLRFNSFTDPWNPVELGSLCEINPKSDPIPNEFVYIDLESVESGQLYEINVIRKEDAPSRAQRLLREKDVLFQTVRPYQKNHYIFKDVFDLPVVASTGFAQLRNEKSSEFIYHLLYSSRFEKQVLIRCTGSNYPAINSADLSEIEVFVPSILEQQKIASFFSLLDQKIEKQQEKVEKLELFKKCILQKIISQEIRFKNENGKDFPEWDIELFEQVATNSSNKINPQSKLNVPCIELENIVGDRGQINGYFLSHEQQSTKNEFTKGSVLFGKLRPYLKKYWYATFDGVCSSEIWVLTSKSPRITNEFLYFIIQSDTFQQAANISSGSKMPRTEWDSVRSLEIPLPSLEEQKKIVSFLFTLEEKISKEESKVESLKQLKNGLLQQMFV
ncbi:restriction endonuclease subunit S [Cohnella massiliensis]|uniref:restriction endonuclease subunit S n=1 Tax=Cohnella massiliensis TaxID=1816691 RepID=UPI0009BBF867|nr:restriction endonuclease subunit S [Cohnella massiliensis]